MFPPHARGWTWNALLITMIVVVSPARAGMDPGIEPHEKRGRCFPRTRGDGPWCSRPPAPVSRFPPHARGWTLGSSLTKSAVGVSPARAGMDPRWACLRNTLTRFPRTRGDGPRLNSSIQRVRAFPPHARGWTRRLPRGRARQHVSPARAGMDPSSGTRRQRSSGFPARAGMDRDAATCSTLSRCFPRTRGDGPVMSTTSPGALTFPPHARGWTRSECRPGCSASVSPARAGMDPSRRRQRIGRSGFPRTRGDGPPFRCHGTAYSWFPPHARGWTCWTESRWRTWAVSPARAGMDRVRFTVEVDDERFPRTRGDGPNPGHSATTYTGFPPHARGWTQGWKWQAEKGPFGHVKRDPHF